MPIKQTVTNGRQNSNSALLPNQSNTEHKKSTAQSQCWGLSKSIRITLLIAPLTLLGCGGGGGDGGSSTSSPSPSTPAVTSPVTSTPATQTPATQTPAASAPVVSAPVTSPSVVSSPVTVAINPAPTPVNAVISNGPQAYKMDELVIPDGFDYNSVDQFDLNIDISHISTDRSFVSVYSRFTTRTDLTYKPDYSSKVIGGPLDNGTFTSNFSAPLSEDILLIEIWFYDGQAPLQQVVASDGSQITW
ncbi:hypothetical protein AB6C75_20890 [Vibrio sp. 10N.237.312.B06]